MIGSCTMRPRQRFGDSRKENSDRFDNTPYSPDRHARHRRSERYEKRGGLSPLRSPLRRDDAEPSENTRYYDGYRRSYSDRRERNRERNRQRYYDNDESRDEWKSEVQPILKEIEFPALDTARQLSFSGPRTSGKLEEFIGFRVPEKRECQEKTSGTRKQDGPGRPAQHTPRRRQDSWAEEMEADDNRLSRVQDDIERMKKRMTDPTFKLEEKDIDLDEASLIRKQKQLDFGKNTPGYQRYTHLYRKIDRTKDHPRTPNKFRKCSRRSWDMQVRIWRKNLHLFDPPAENGASNDLDERDTRAAQEGPLVKDSDSGINLESSSSSSPRTESSSMFSPGSSQTDDFDTDLMDLALGTTRHPADRFLEMEDFDEW